MSVAFNDVAIWRDQLQTIPDLTDYRALDDAYTLFQNKRKLNHSFVVNVLAQALYELFSADDGKDFVPLTSRFFPKCSTSDAKKTYKYKLTVLIHEPVPGLRF